MNIQELDTIAELNLNIKIILFNNGHLGLVRQQQELFYNKNYIASRFYSKPSFCAIANGFGVKAIDLSGETKPVPVLSSVLSENGPCLINIPIQETSNVLPIVPPGAANHEMIGE
jgi:acetolactate synthase-1/2/3 large subunit